MTRRGKEIAPPSEDRWHRVARSCATLLVVPLISSVASGCGGAFPVSEGKVLAITNDDGILEKSDPGYDTTLQVRWLGSTCYLIQLGDAALLTDPFFSHHPLLQVALGEIVSDPDIVNSKISALPGAEGIFIGHSHYDHMLDLAATLEQPGWQDVPVYGSITTRNLLCGYGEEVAANWTQAEADGQWHRFSEPVLDYKLEYMAVPSQHAPQVAGVLLNSGVVEDCLDHPPIRASDFKIGDPYTFVFRLSNDGAEFIVYFADSASDAPLGFPDESVQSVDVAILSVEGWQNADGYPGEFMHRLSPRNVLVSHYDNYFQQGDGVREILPFADLDGFLTKAQESADYPEFEEILVPDVDTMLHFRSP